MPCLLGKLPQSAVIISIIKREESLFTTILDLKLSIYQSVICEEFRKALAGNGSKNKNPKTRSKKINIFFINTTLFDLFILHYFTRLVVADGSLADSRRNFSYARASV